MPSQLRHHHIEQDEIGLELARAHQRIFSVDRRDDLVALRVEPNAQHFKIGGVVIDNQDPRRVSQAVAPSASASGIRELWRGSRAG